MGNNRIKAVIFDLGNVLIDFNHGIAAKRISEFSDKSVGEIYNLFFDSGLTALFESGRITPAEFFLRIRELLHLKLDYEKFLPVWNEIFFLSERNRAVYSLAKALRENYKLALLSNINILHFQYLKKTFPVFDAFHYFITSFELGCTKPDPQIYKKTLDILRVPAASVVYTDDRVELVQCASKLDIRSFVFKDVEQLKKDLSSAGININ
jgi:putative hydrolase of the HAD superfamily